MVEGKKVLVVEDEPIIAMDLKMSLGDLGYDVIGPTATADKALELIKDNKPDIAVLDFNIRGGTSEEIALYLIEQGVPVIFLSGDSDRTNVDHLNACLLLQKPIQFSSLKSVLDEILFGNLTQVSGLFAASTLSVYDDHGAQFG